MLICTPAIVLAAPAKNASKASSKASAQKSAANKSAKAKFAAPIVSAIVVDAGSGQVLSELNADARGYPASLTKMMTLYLLFDALERREVRQDTAIPVSQRAAAAAPSKLGLKPRSTITVEQAIQALITKSANDVAIATAERLAGTEDRFAEKMTARARALGMSQTTFKNAHGLPNPGQLSSARDMAILANHLIKDFPQYYSQFSRMEFNYQGQTIRTHNRLLEFYEGADGIKTGYTAASGFNLVASATRNGYRVIGVIFGGTSAGARDQRLAGLMDQGFAALAGQPEMAVAARGGLANGNLIGAQIAQLSQPQTAENTTEEGDRDEPFASVTRRGSPIEMAALPPLPLAPDSADPSTAGIQIGAFADRGVAEFRAAKAAATLRATFAQAGAVVQPAMVKGRKVYRARIHGLDEKNLLRACSLLGAQAKAGCRAVPATRTAAR